MTAYYNDYDPKACDWLEELIRRGLLPAGVVDRRSILDVRADDLTGFVQCHFFAGIGGWPLALRLAGLPDDRPVWTGSPPCQPFSAAGARKGKDDARHLAPHFADLIAAGQPPILLGEQVASPEVFGKAASGARKVTHGAPEWAWIDDLSARLEAAHYAVGASDLPSSCVGAPHIRQRCFFGAVRLADADDAGPQGRVGMPQCADERLAGASGMVGWLADMHGDGLERGVKDARPWVTGRPLGQIAALAGWPTPMAGTPAQNGNNEAGNNDSSRKMVELAGWPTPQARDGDPNGRTSTPQTAEIRFAQGKRNLDDAAQLVGPMRITALGEILTGSTAGMESGGQLSPHLSRYLMGYPIEWCYAAVAAIPQKKRK